MADIFHTGGILLDDGPQNGGQCQEDEEEYGQSNRTQEVPKGISLGRFPLPFLHFRLPILWVKDAQLVEFSNILDVMVSRENRGNG